MGVRRSTQRAADPVEVDGGARRDRSHLHGREGRSKGQLDRVRQPLLEQHLLLSLLVPVERQLHGVLAGRNGERGAGTADRPAIELHHGALARGERSAFVATGQTGIAITGWGIAVDHVIADYIAGAAERLVDMGAEHGDLLWVEGQGSLLHPGYSGVTHGLLLGCQPDVLVLQHLAGQTVNDDYTSRPIPPLPEVIGGCSAGTGAPLALALVALLRRRRRRPQG